MGLMIVGADGKETAYTGGSALGSSGGSNENLGMLSAVEREMLRLEREARAEEIQNSLETQEYENNISKQNKPAPKLSHFEAMMEQELNSIEKENYKRFVNGADF